jgi:hypothetical protein
VPRKTKKKRQQGADEPLTLIVDDVVGLLFYVFYGLYLVIKSLATRRPIEKSSLKQQKQFQHAFVGLIVLIWIIIGACLTVPGLWRLVVLVAGLFMLIPIIILLRRQRKLKAMTSEIGKQLQRALETMDTTARWYNTEEEANRELVTCLKAQGICDVTYQYRLPDHQTADAKVGNILVEGKLSPNDTREVDRLLGQLTRYTQYGHKVNVVIYGPIHKYARARIENEIQSRYLNRVFLTYLNNPRRQRARI